MKIKVFPAKAGFRFSCLVFLLFIIVLFCLCFRGWMEGKRGLTVVYDSKQLSIEYNVSRSAIESVECFKVVLGYANENARNFNKFSFSWEFVFTFYSNDFQWYGIIRFREMLTVILYYLDPTIALFFLLRKCFSAFSYHRI